MELAFGYVHNRLSLIPSDREALQVICLHLKVFAKNLIFGILIFSILLTLDIWMPPLIQFSEIAVQETVKFVKGLLPQPLPQIRGAEQIRSISSSVLSESKKNWKNIIESLSLQIQAPRTAQKIPQFLEKHKGLFEINLPLDFSDMRSFQGNVATPFRDVPLNASEILRNTVLPFVTKASEPSSIVEAHISLLRTLSNFNDLSIREYVNSAQNRKDAVENYLLNGKNLRESSLRALANIAAWKKTFSQKEEVFNASSQQAQENFTNDLNGFLAQKTDQNLKNFILNKQQAVDTHANVGLFTSLEKKFTPEIQILQRNLDAVEKNKDALILGIQITSVSGVDLGLVK